MHYVYRTYDKDGNSLYIGVTHNFFYRMDSHHNKEWWGDVYRFEIDRYRTPNEALAGERDSIKKELPKFNKVHHPDYDRLTKTYTRTKAKNDKPANT